eukprot:CAMPEP_0174754150 /NCGR_PEP_ID=MMETSP1094-20130205/105470_1 /TAXON_ID=156173 /ORGANISM="Chrysochromulina brevifilum, Strain UTEX LB 985" /LENGTH=84 /DNA_ID=CAMNT_0015959995 /DNA_START=169 /DNA_END=420 /DNA_ORIENTATION=+
MAVVEEMWSTLAYRKRAVGRAKVGLFQSRAVKRSGTVPRPTDAARLGLMRGGASTSPRRSPDDLTDDRVAAGLAATRSVPASLA